MKKKTSKKSEAPLKEVVEQAVEQLSCKREQNSKLASELCRVQPTEGGSQIREAAAAAEEQPKRRKVVEFHILASIMEFATEKAQLLAFHTEAGEEVKFWLSKSLTHFVADGDAPEKMICRIPAWLYYKSGLDKFFPVEHWSLIDASRFARKEPAI